MNDTRDKFSNEMKATLGEWIREENLEMINAQSALVSVRQTIYTRYIKRLIDIIVSFCAIIITLPINLIIGIITYFDVGKPIFFHQERTGKDGVTFRLTKFRNMRDITDENGILLPADQRVTKWGHFVRKTSLDELLNFVYVLKGDMSLIGPRPLPSTYDNRYSDRHKQRLAVRPGLECPPRDMETYDGSWQERFENDVWYVENVSFVTDCKMILKMFQFALNRKASNRRGEAKTSAFIGYDRHTARAIDLNEVSEEYVIKVQKQYGIIHELTSVLNYKQTG